MAFKIPIQAITCEAAVTGLVSLVRFLTNAAKDIKTALKDIDWDLKYPTVADVKEAFYVHLYQELLAQELALTKQSPDPAQEGDKSSQCISQYIEFVLDAASRVIISLYKNGGDSTTLRQVSLKPKVIEKIFRRFYAEFLSSIFGFYLEQRMMLKTNDRDDGKANHNLLHSKDFKNIRLRRSYLNNRIRYCREIIYKTMQIFPLSKTFYQSRDNEQMKAEIRRITGKLARTGFAVDISRKTKPIPFYLVCGQSAAPELVKKYSVLAERVLRLNEDISKGNITLRQFKMERLLGKELTAKSKDLLRLAGFFYVSDTQVPRHQQWRRRIHFIVPVEEVELWTDMAQQLSYTLSFLSGDCISVEFYRRQPVDCANVKHPKSLTSNETVSDCTCLLSGGIDSFAGVLKLVKDKHRPIVISHFTQSSVAHVQKELLKFIRNKYGNEAVMHLQLKIGKNKRPGEEKKENQLDHNCENTQRTRSFLYFSMAAAAAVESGVDKLFITENGVSSFNLPVTRAYASTRCGRPTHPRNIYNFNRIINRLYGKDVSMSNRYIFKTKGEFIAAAIETRDEKEVLEKTTTCPRYRFRLKNDDRLNEKSQVNIDNINNCGLCYECLLRLASIHAASIRPDMNKYIMHPLKDTLKLKDSEITTLFRFITNCTDWEGLSDRELLLRYPDLCLPARYFPGNSVSTAEHKDFCNQAIAMHKRYAGEFLDWLIDEAGEELKEMTGLFREKPKEALDVHCHVDRFADPFYLMAKAAVENVKVVAVGMNLQSTRINFHFAKYFDSIIPGAGLHPVEAPAYLEKHGNLKSLFAYIDQTPFVGEIGLDYFSVKNEKKRKKQQEAFGQILDYCKGKNKVLNIHSKKAEEDVLGELERYKIKKAILHWYSGPEKFLRVIEANRYYISVNRSIERNKKLQAMVKKLPRELVLVESDGPMTKGSQPTQTPFDFPKVLEQLSILWGIDKEKTRQQVLENFRSLTSSSG